MMQAAEIHARVSWPTVLEQLGIPKTALRNKHGPCPACGGRDRFRFDHEKRGRGSYICSQCGAGDGFKLLERVYGWDFSEARRRVVEVAGLTIGAVAWIPPAQREAPVEARATPDMRVYRLRRGRCRLEDCEQAVDYLASRGLWPLPEGCTLAAHVSAEYFHGPHRIGRYSALVADVVDINGELVTAHVTFLAGGKKLDLADPESMLTDPRTLPPRKILSKMDGRTGCAVRLMPAGDTLGIAEGIETALSAAVIEGLSVWAALNTSLLAKFEPPPQTQRLVIYGDNDAPGLMAAGRLMERLQTRIRGGLTIEFRPPPAPAKDWNDVLASRNRSPRGEVPTHD
jgi:putative DNA primase/helicase